METEYYACDYLKNGEREEFEGDIDLDDDSTSMADYEDTINMKF